MKRELDTPYGPIEYDFERKKVRRLNLRVRPDGSVAVSAPARVPVRDVEDFVYRKAGWIVENRQAVLENVPEAPGHTAEEAFALFTTVSDRVFPLFSDVLGGQKPVLKVRTMKTRWGVCHISKRQITLNTRLADKPMEAIEYVVLHEYVHFLHPDHQAGFHAEMARLMPDYKARRKLLREL